MPQLHAHFPKTAHLEDMSRELQSPLRKLMGHAEYIFAQSIDPMVKYSAKMVFEKTHQMLNHVRNSLDLSDMELGHFQLHNAHFNLSGSVSGLVTEFQADAVEHQLCLKLHYDNRIPELVFLDAKRLRQVMSHLLSDSMKHTPDKGQIHLSVVLVDQRREILFVLKNDEIKSMVPVPIHSADQGYANTCDILSASLTDKLIARMGGRIEFSRTRPSSQICYFSLPLHTRLKVV